VARVVLLLGPPGSGKTTIGEELGRRGLRWREWEPVILARWGSREAFVARKAEALPQLYDEVGAGWPPAARRPGRHISDDPGRNDAVWPAVAAGPGAHRRADLVLATDRRTPADLAEEILAVCAPPTQGHPAAGASP